jgi:hypothetical protein
MSKSSSFVAVCAIHFLVQIFIFRSRFHRSDLSNLPSSCWWSQCPLLRLDFRCQDCILAQIFFGLQQISCTLVAFLFLNLLHHRKVFAFFSDFHCRGHRLPLSASCLFLRRRILAQFLSTRWRPASSAAGAALPLFPARKAFAVPSSPTDHALLC